MKKFLAKIHRVIDISNYERNTRNKLNIQRNIQSKYIIKTYKQKHISSQFVQVHDTLINFYRPSASRNTELAKALDLPNSPKESGSG